LSSYEFVRCFCLLFLLTFHFIYFCDFLLVVNF
jgi:hypothetical protein